MKLFVQVAFDLTGGKPPKYDAVEGWLSSVGLKRSVVGSGGELVRLPANTFAGVRDCYNSALEAIQHIQEQFQLSANWDGCEGRALITVSPNDQTTIAVQVFGT